MATDVRDEVLEKLESATPFPGAPAFWKRFVGLGIIYGFAARSPYPEDWHLENRGWAGGRGDFPAQCFSVQRPGGEWGFVPVRDVEPITRERFLELAERGWMP